MARRLPAALVVALFSLPLPGSAEEGEPASAPAQTVVVQGKKPAEGAGVSGSVETVDLAQYAARAVALSEVLARVAGVEVTQMGGAGAGAYVGIRGAVPSEVLVTLDGARLNPLAGGGADLDLIPLELLDSVEVLRGTGASRFGADALGGVIALHSGAAREGAVLSTDSWGDLSAVASSFARTDGWLVSGTARQERLADRWSYHDATRALEVDRTNTGGEELAGALGAEGRLGGGEAQLRISGSSLEAGSPGLSEFPTPEARRQEAFALLSGSFQEGPLWAEVSSRTEQAGYDDPQPILGSLPIHTYWRGESAQSSVVVKGAGPGSLLLSGGADLRGEAISDEAAGWHRRWVTGAHGSLQGSSGLVEAELTTRLEADLENGAGALWAVLPSGGVVWRASRSFELSTHLGRAWRLPSFLERWLPDQETVQGNPELAPEDAWSGDLRGRLLLAPDLRVEGAFFGTTLQQGIVWAAVAPYRFQPVNTGPAWWTGGELSVRGGLDSLSAELAWTHLESRLLETGAPLPGRPADSLFLRLAARIRPLEPFAEARFLSARDADFYGNLTVPSSLALAAGVTLLCVPGRMGELAATLEGTNLGDTDVRDSLFLPQPGRTFWLTLAWRHARPSGDAQ